MAKWAVTIRHTVWHTVHLQKCVPLVMKFRMLYLGSHVCSYMFKYNLWPHQSWTGNEWAKNIYTEFCLIPSSLWQSYSLLPSLCTFSLTSHNVVSFRSIIWVMKSPFITCVLWDSKLKQKMRHVVIFTQAQSTWFISKNSHMAFLGGGVRWCVICPQIHKPRPY